MYICNLDNRNRQLQVDELKALHKFKILYRKIKGYFTYCCALLFLSYFNHFSIKRPISSEEKLWYRRAETQQTQKTILNFLMGPSVCNYFAALNIPLIPKGSFTIIKIIISLGFTGGLQIYRPVKLLCWRTSWIWSEWDNQVHEPVIDEILIPTVYKHSRTCIALYS